MGLEQERRAQRAVNGRYGPSLRRASQISYCLSVNFGHSFHLNNRSGNGMRLAVKMALVPPASSAGPCTCLSSRPAPT